MGSENYQPVVNADLTATVTVGGTTTGAVDLGGTQLVGIFVPSTFDGTTITIQAAPTLGGTYVPVQNGVLSASAYTITTTAGQFVPIDNLAILAGVRFIKLVCGTSQTTTDTVFTLATRPV